ncbi:hypothetical protein CLOM_g14638 [Closterium sp. NIES-68]|nr:hypothetical protein CLOM_g14638 [Closterium sp. NIES-68]GJP69675.1 hypothetical protein CLOP_g661 [Closterium sp. NIES-67]
MAMATLACGWLGAVGEEMRTTCAAACIVDWRGNQGTKRGKATLHDTRQLDLAQRAAIRHRRAMQQDVD